MRARPMLRGAAHTPRLAGLSDDGPIPKDANERDALTLVGAGTEVARHLRPVCANWSDERFGGVVYEAARLRLRGELPPDDVARLRREYQAHRDVHLAPRRERAG